jgi:succinate dehydrogenase / fumarate reductase cytochrome b subunit
MTSQTPAISSTFIWRRVHSLLGLWLVVFLLEHFTVNSQATLWIGDDGIGFIRLANFLESLPYLQVVETVLIGVPLALHGVWGIRRALQAKFNSGRSSGAAPSLKYGRNRAFTWQRLTSWILLFGIIAHVIQMRFIEYPKKVMGPKGEEYLTDVTVDDGLYTLAARLNVSLYTSSAIEEIKKSPTALPKWVEALESFNLSSRELVASSPSPGTAMLLTIRDTFKSPLVSILYTIFVLAAAFHACNGVWTCLITWGFILSYRSQKAMIPVSVMGIFLLAFLGLAAIWGSYWVNLRY